MKTLRSLLLLVSVLPLAGLALTGCNLNQTAPMPVPGAAMRGIVHGGQQPISQAQIQLYAASTNGYGIGATYSPGSSLFGATPVYSDNAGNFNITNDYTCPSSTTPVYLVATGGNPGLPSTASSPVNNSAIALMVALGPCGQLSSQPFVVVNELTTVASVWALAPFMTGITAIGTSGPTANSTGNFVGLTNAFATVNKLVNINTGQVNGPALPATALAPTANLDTLADILAACINTAGPTGSGSACDNLFTYTTLTGGVVPTDTVGAALSIAQHPNNRVSDLTALAQSTSPFQPTTTPIDFSLVIRYSGGGLSAPSAVAVDTAGNLWVPNATGNSVTKLDALGVTASDSTGFLSGAGGFTTGQLTAPSAVAIDLSGNAWVTNLGNSSISQLNAAGSSATVYSGGGLNAPTSIAIDATGSAWIANSGSITAINTSGAMSSYSTIGVSSPSAIAINPK